MSKCDSYCFRAEELFLPTSRIEKKRRQLIREYDRAKKREDRKKNELRKKLSIDDAGIIRELNVNEYEKNKARNHKTNIQFPTPVSTMRSDRSSRGRKPSRSSSAQPRRSQSAYRRCDNSDVDYHHNSNLNFMTSNSQRSPEKQLSEALSAMSVRDARSRPLGLSQDQVNTLHDAACAPGGPNTGQGHDPHQTSAMDRYMEMKTQQDLDNISCNH